jgi:MazG family protein
MIMNNRDGIESLLSVIARLRDPKTGCPWDIEQDFASIAPYTIEEAYEVADAIERKDMSALKEELGDLLLQVVFHAQMAEEQRLFTFNDVAKEISDKLVSRHPHVFGDANAADAEAVLDIWEERKAQERLRRAAGENRAPSVLDDVAAGLPALMRALKLQKRMARVGFDWKDAAPIFAKLDEELAELKAEIAVANQDLIEEEFGDLLFAIVNLGRHLKVDSEEALRRANAKVIHRFQHIETELQRAGRDIKTATLEDMEALWQDAKRVEKEQAAA